MTNRLPSLHHLGFRVLLVLAGVITADASSPKRESRRLDAQPLQFLSSSGDVVSFKPGSIAVASAERMLRVDLLGTNAAPVAYAKEPRANTAHAAVQPLREVRYTAAWAGVTLVYQAQPGSILKTTYYVDASYTTNPIAQIRLHYNRPVGLDTNSNLLVSFPNGTMTDSAPFAWQEIAGRRTPVRVVYKLLGNGVVGFEAQDYDHTRPLVIDPSLTWTTFLGGTAIAWGLTVLEDGSGNTYVGGYSTATWGSPVQSFSGTQDGFLAKLNSSGVLVWNTFLGGTTTSVYDVALDSGGNIYVTGETAATWGSPVRAYNDNYDGFVAKLSSTGSLMWNTFLGSSDFDWCNSIAVDSSGNVYVAGDTGATWGSPIRAFAGSFDAFAAKLTSTGSLTWNTFLGAGSSNDGNAICLDSSGNLYVTGDSGATWGSPIAAFAGTQDAFEAKLSNSGNLTWNTFLGGSGTVTTQGGAIDANGNIYVVGGSTASWGSPVRAYTSGNDGFAAKINNSGALIWNTFLGGSGSDETAYSVAVDNNGDVYVAGHSNAAWGNPWRAYGGGYDAWATKLTYNGSLTWNAFFGGSGDDWGYGIAVSSIGNIAVSGGSSATWGSPVSAFSGSNAAFVTIINDASVLFFKRREQDP